METRKLYDEDASKWVRRKPNSLSDFTGRPAVFDLCGDVRGLDVADLGCGEGYCTRELKSRGAKSMIGIELSQKMVDAANAAEREAPLGIEYRQGDVRKLELDSDKYDLVTAVFVFNYVVYADMLAALHEIYRITKPGGAFVFSIPHPSFPFIGKKQAPFYFDFEGRGYFSGRDSKNEGEIHCVDGTKLRVQMIHKPLEDYFTALRAVGFTKMPIVKELRVLPEHMAENPAFFGGVNDVPLHMAFRVEK